MFLVRVSRSRCPHDMHTVTNLAAAASWPSVKISITVLSTTVTGAAAVVGAVQVAKRSEGANPVDGEEKETSRHIQIHPPPCR